MANDELNSGKDPAQSAADAAMANAEGPTHAANAQSGSVEQLQAELQETKDRLLRAQAEIENVRRRGQREVQETRKFANQPLMLDLLPVIDNLERALSATEQSSEQSGLLEGVRMVYQQLTEALAKHNCARVPAEGQEFDPLKHEALAHMPCDEHEKGQVAIVNLPGYQLHDRVIRPAQVVVSAGKPES